MTELNRSYLCGYSLYHMLRVHFPNRFGNFNHEGFCYTFSAAAMLGLKRCRYNRLVRGYLAAEGFETDHSWVEVKAFGHWWVIDLRYLTNGMMPRRRYYQTTHAEVQAIYPRRVFWQDPAALQFYQRLQRPESSKIFFNLYWYYTPSVGEIEFHPREELMLELPENTKYYLFPPKYGYKFDQEIINELMARPARRSPRRRTLRRLDHWYKRETRELAENPPT